MPTITRPEFVPDASLSRAEMESMQRAIAQAAQFEDDLGFDPTPITNPIDAPSGDESGGHSASPLVAGVDQSFLLDRDPERALSAIVVMCDGDVVERVSAITPLEIPYIPGLLAFREGRPILEAMGKLTTEPDLYLFDGSGRMHFREAGIATHVGVVYDVPAIGVAKSLLCGEPTASLEKLEPGAQVPIEATGTSNGADSLEVAAGTRLGYAVQTRQFDSPNRHVNPLYVSPGHRIGPETAANLVLGLTAGYKLPEPVRLADGYATEAKDDDLE